MQTPKLRRGGRRGQQRRERQCGGPRGMERRPIRGICSSSRPNRVRQPLEPAEIPLFAQLAIERGDRLPVDRADPVPKHEMRRPQQRDHRRPREARLDELEDEIERGGERLGGERQRVERLIRQTCALRRLREPDRGTAAVA